MNLKYNITNKKNSVYRWFRSKKMTSNYLSSVDEDEKEKKRKRNNYSVSR